MKSSYSSLEISHYPVMLKEVVEACSLQKGGNYVDCTFGGGGYTKEILNLVNKNLIKAAAHITGGGLPENIVRSIPDNLSADIDLSKIKTKKIFSWLKSNNISDHEMLRTFNCGVGFCIIIEKKNLKKIKKYFTKDFMPYLIGNISKDTTKIRLFNKIKW